MSTGQPPGPPYDRDDDPRPDPLDTDPQPEYRTPPPPGGPYEPQRANYGYAPPPQKPKRKKWPWVLLAIALASLLLLGACLAAGIRAIDGTVDPGPVPTAGESESPTADSSDSPKAAKPYTATVEKCEPDEFDFNVVVKVKNNTEERKTYMLDLLLEDKNGDTVGTGVGTVEVNPGKSGKTTLLASLDESYEGKKSDVECKVTVKDSF